MLLVSGHIFGRTRFSTEKCIAFRQGLTFCTMKHEGFCLLVVAWNVFFCRGFNVVSPETDGGPAKRCGDLALLRRFGDGGLSGWKLRWKEGNATF